MFGTVLNFEPTAHTFYVHVSATGRKSRVYRPRPSRGVQLRRALAEQTGSRR
jgi:hypothetical protein